MYEGKVCKLSVYPTEFVESGPVSNLHWTYFEGTLDLKLFSLPGLLPWHSNWEGYLESQPSLKDSSWGFVLFWEQGRSLELENGLCVEKVLIWSHGSSSYIDGDGTDHFLRSCWSRWIWVVKVRKHYIYGLQFPESPQCCLGIKGAAVQNHNMSNLLYCYLATFWVPL